ATAPRHLSRLVVHGRRTRKVQSFKLPRRDTCTFAPPRSGCARRCGDSDTGGRMRIRFENHDLVTEERMQMIDVTDDVVAAVERSEVENGLAVVYSPHTTCAIVINEREDGFAGDFADVLDRLIPSSGAYYRHDDLSI